MSDVSNQLIERFFRYVNISSQSNAANLKMPSSEGQLSVVQLLAKELKDLGLQDIYIDQNGVLTALKKGNQAQVEKIGFVAHVDTVDVGLSAEIKPQKLLFKGEDICLNKAKDIWLKVEEHPEILKYPNEEIIFSDGTSVLGADNKAAVAIVMTLLAELSKQLKSHGDIYVAFVPDEEIGLRGSKVLDLSRFKVDFAYTIDCCELGEVVYETFNAASVLIDIVGVTAHPMSAKNVLVNPIRVAYDLLSYFDRYDTPEHTEGREGYFWFTDMSANANCAQLKISIRDFDLANFETRKRYIQETINLLQARHPRAKITYKISDIYGNIGNSLGEDKRSIDLIFRAMQDLNIEANVIPMRGGTDGSALSARGIVTPNYFTGAHNFHSCFEFLPISSFVKSYELTQKICELVAAQ